MRKTLVSQTETRSYDSFQRMTSMTQFDGTAITYNYSATANGGKLVSQVTGSETVNYTYDSLGRLSQATTAGAGGWGMSWTYDGWGNRLQQAAVKGSVPTITTITDPATNRIQAHTYDANGNTVNTPLQGAMTYDVLNRLTTVASDTYGYDPSNKRVWKNDEFTFWGAGGERIGRYTVAKLVDPTSAHVFVFQKVSVDEYFGGRRLKTMDAFGSVGSYYPYGEPRTGTLSNTDAFATYYRDSTGLDYAQQRYYQSVAGRFATPDPYSARSKGVDNPSAPSTWNRYSYAANDPANFGDPKGNEPWWWFDLSDSFAEVGIGDPGGMGGGGNPCFVSGFAGYSFCALQIPIVAYEPPPTHVPTCAALADYNRLDTTNQAIINRVLNENSFNFIGGRAPDGQGRLTGPQVTRSGVYDENRLIVNAIRNRGKDKNYEGSVYQAAWQMGEFNEALAQKWFSISVGDLRACDDLSLALAALAATPDVFAPQIYAWRSWFATSASGLASSAGTKFFGYGY
jgi:RHS repeat-associated protein